MTASSNFGLHATEDRFQRIAARPPIIELRNIYKVYPPMERALSGISLSIKAGEFVFIAGSSGAGKSTLLKILMAQEKVSSGEVLVSGADLTSIAPSAVGPYRRDCGVIFQDYKLLPHMTVLENVAFSLEISGVQRESSVWAANVLLDSVRLKHKATAYPPMLSGGEQQRVAVARALINKPKLILADEPTGNLDPDMTMNIFRMLQEANRCGATVIVASHNLQLIEQMNKRTLVLDRGKVVGDFASPGG